MARLGTATRDGGVRLVPICFALVDARLASAVDHKPKRSPHLQRLADIVRTGHATILVDHFDEDWSRLWWVRVTGRATVHDDAEPFVARARSALVAKYEQYADRPPAGPLYSVRLDDVRWWRASDG